MFQNIPHRLLLQYVFNNYPAYVRKKYIYTTEYKYMENFIRYNKCLFLLKPIPLVFVCDAIHTQHTFNSFRNKITSTSSWSPLFFVIYRHYHMYKLLLLFGIIIITIKERKRLKICMLNIKTNCCAFIAPTHY